MSDSLLHQVKSCPSLCDRNLYILCGFPTVLPKKTIWDLVVEWELDKSAFYFLPRNKLCDRHNLVHEFLACTATKPNLVEIFPLPQLSSPEAGNLTPELCDGQFV